MEIGKEKAVMVPASTMGLLLAMASSADWKTESTKKFVAGIVGVINDAGDIDTKNELNAYILAFSALETQACGEDAEEIIDGIQRTSGDEIEMLERVLQKIEEIENVRKKRRNKE